MNIEGHGYYIYDFNQLCGRGNLSVRTNIGNIIINENNIIWGLDFISKPTITEIEDNFLYNKGVIAPSINLYGITKIGNHFMYRISTYPVSDPYFQGKIKFGNSLKSIGENFLTNQIKYSSNLTLPNSLLSIGTRFMYCCKKYTATIDFQNLNTEIFNSLSQNELKYILATNNNSDLCYTEGIKVKGTNISNIKQLLTDSDNSPFRKLIEVENE